jgi:hypothetical protein
MAAATPHTAARRLHAGMVRVQREVGGGSFLAGYRRAYADSSSLDLHAALGLQTLLSAQHSVQLSPVASATLAATWQPRVGAGVQFTTTRQLSDSWQGEYTWVVGPEEAAGMALGISRHTERLKLSGKVEVKGRTVWLGFEGCGVACWCSRRRVRAPCCRPRTHARTQTAVYPPSLPCPQVGSSTALAVRAAWRASDALVARAGARLALGWRFEVDAGGMYTVSELSAAGVSVSVSNKVGRGHVG